MLRFLPFLVFSGKRETPPYIVYLGKVLPYAIMGMLVIYCLRGISFTATANYLPELIACAVVVLAHVWKRNTLLSIISGTVCYMLLVQFVF
ncbi:MAG: AzlD domain-containing protein [Clostridiales bacterium]|nr:AzlD domain-containing protein [Clostridiales bacterium]